jgi:hypothetical protein
MVDGAGHSIDSLHKTSHKKRRNGKEEEMTPITKQRKTLGQVKNF